MGGPRCYCLLSVLYILSLKVRDYTFYVTKPNNHRFCNVFFSDLLKLCIIFDRFQCVLFLINITFVVVTGLPVVYHITYTLTSDSSPQSPIVYKLLYCRVFKWLVPLIFRCIGYSNYSVLVLCVYYCSLWY